MRIDSKLWCGWLVGWLVLRGMVVVVVDMHGRPGKYIKKEERDKIVTICSSKIYIFLYLQLILWSFVVVVILALRGQLIIQICGSEGGSESGSSNFFHSFDFDFGVNFGIDWLFSIDFTTITMIVTVA